MKCPKCKAELVNLLTSANVCPNNCVELHDDKVRHTLSDNQWVFCGVIYQVIGRPLGLGWTFHTLLRCDIHVEQIHFTMESGSATEKDLATFVQIDKFIADIHDKDNLGDKGYRLFLRDYGRYYIALPR